MTDKQGLIKLLLTHNKNFWARKDDVVVWEKHNGVVKETIIKFNKNEHVINSHSHFYKN